MDEDGAVLFSAVASAVKTSDGAAWQPLVVMQTRASEPRRVLHSIRFEAEADAYQFAKVFARYEAERFWLSVGYALRQTRE
jgi:hypothetical protein